MKKPIDLLRRELHAFCELAQRRGYSIKPGSFRGNYAMECCPLGAVQICTGAVVAGAWLFGDDDEALYSYSAFWQAFDGSQFHSGPYADLGREFRAHYIGAAQ